MIENGFYKISPDFIQLIKGLGGQYLDTKERPIFCCFEDKYTKNIYWAIPTSDLSHRSEKQKEKIQSYCNLNINDDIRASFYHLGTTNKPAIYRISNCLPVTDKYIDGPYLSQGSQLFLKSKEDIRVIRKKLSRILLDERKHPNKYEQHITSILEYLRIEVRDK